jgi:hypothetical protein
MMRLSSFPDHGYVVVAISVYFEGIVEHFVYPFFIGVGHCPWAEAWWIAALACVMSNLCAFAMRQSFHAKFRYRQLLHARR